MLKTFLIFIAIAISNVSYSQVNDDEMRLITLHRNKVGKTFVYGKWNDKGGMETHLTYLGKAVTKKGIYKIMNSTWLWGLSKRATNRILIFNDLNQYIGEYNVTIMADLPKKFKNGVLIFENKNNDCNPKVSSKINLKNGIPKEFLRECKNGYGDIFQFYSL